MSFSPPIDRSNGATYIPTFYTRPARTSCVEGTSPPLVERDVVQPSCVEGTPSPLPQRNVVQLERHEPVTELERLEQREQYLIAQIQSCERTILELERDNNLRTRESTTELFVARREVQNLTEQVNQARRERDEQTQRADDLAQALTREQQTTARLRRQLQESRQNEHQALATCQNARIDCANLETRLQHSESRSAELLQQLQSVQRELNLERRIANLKREYKTKKAELNDLEIAYRGKAKDLAPSMGGTALTVVCTAFGGPLGLFSLVGTTAVTYKSAKNRTDKIYSDPTWRTLNRQTIDIRYEIIRLKAGHTREAFARMTAHQQEQILQQCGIPS